MTSRTLRLSDDSTVHVLDQGQPDQGQGEPVMLIHGVGLRAEAWGPQIAALSHQYRVIAVDLPGHGQSDPLSGDPRLPDYVMWAAQVIEGLGLGSMSVVGHSMGALMTAGLAVERPELVRRAAMLCAVHGRDVRARADVMARATEIAVGNAVAAVPDRWFYPEQSALRDRVAHWLQGAPRAGYAAAYRAFAEGDSVYSDRLGEIRCPLLVLTADGDPNSTPEMTRAMASSAPLGRAVVIAGHRHMVTLTAPEAVNAELSRWLLEREVVG